MSLVRARSHPTPPLLAAGPARPAEVSDSVNELAQRVIDLVFDGCDDEAAAAAETLRQAPARDVAAWRAKAIALTYLGDDVGVLAAFKAAENDLQGVHSTDAGLLHHLAGVAAWNQGRGFRCFMLLRWAQRLAPDREAVGAILSEYDRPRGERFGPWAFPLEEWLPPAAVKDVVQFVTRRFAKGEARPRSASRLLQRYPALRKLLPRLLRQGDPMGMLAALLLAEAAGPREMGEPLRRFALGRRGSDTLRTTALQILARWGRLGSALMWVWRDGKQRVLQPVWPELDSLPLYSPAVTALMAAAREDLEANRSKDMERHLRNALELEPHNLVLRQNLAACRYVQGHHQEAQEAMRKLNREHPREVVAATMVAVAALEEGRPAEARALLEPLRERQRMAAAEFSMLCDAWVQLSLAERRPQDARAWCNTLRTACPEGRLPYRLRFRVTLQGLFGWLRGT